MTSSSFRIPRECDAMLRSLRFASLVLLMALFAEAPTQAYLDPGAGSMLLQVLLGGAAAAGVVLKLFWRNITQPFRRRHPDEGEQ
jgi:hypothetical protein